MINGIKLQTNKAIPSKDLKTNSKPTNQSVQIQDPNKPTQFTTNFINTLQYLTTMPKVNFMSLNNLEANKNTSTKNSMISFGTSEAKEVFLKDYKPPTHLIDRTDLKFELNSEEDVIVSSKLKVSPNPKSKEPANILTLSGAPEKADEGSQTPTIELIEVKVNGRKLPNDEYTRKDDKLILKDMPEKQFNLEIKTRINPKENHALAGLYKSGNLLTTQCEAEGFRNMTFYLDRPDVMSKYTTTIVADKGKFPVMISNGNPGERKDIGGGREEITWTDPFKKPSYLFAMVAGNLDVKEDAFTTKSGRDVKIKIYADPKDMGKLDHAMKSVKQAMKWDEDRFGREYDLDLFQVVGVKDFNAGAMENKGLNVFQTAYLLADPNMATDADYENVQRVIGHEYFHNWTGDRVTLQKWFDLTLKEGLTVFRDQEFTSDLNSRGVKRINDVNTMRIAQFAEDASAMAHPIKPDKYAAIDNFYTATVYDKGAEVIRMIHTILGEKDFRKGMDLYFERHDGQAVTTEDFVKAMADASGKDFSQFEKTWYNQAGTPTLDIKDSYDPVKKEYKLTVKQSTPSTPEQPTKEPFHIPIRVGLLDSHGKDMKLQLAENQKDLLVNNDVLNLKEGETTFVFKNVSEKPVPSLLRGWSAPVKVNYDYSTNDLKFLMANDSDNFNRWEAGQKLCENVIKEQVKLIQQGQDKEIDPSVMQAFKKVLEDKNLDPAVKAQALILPNPSYIEGLYPDGQVDVQAIDKAYKKMLKEIGKELEPLLLKTFNENRSTENREYQWNVEDAGERAIKNTALGYLIEGNPEKYLHYAIEQFDRKQNLTDVRSAFRKITKYADDKTCKQKTEEFYQDHKESSTAVYQMFQDLALADRPNTLQNVKDLMKHEAFDPKNPLCVRRVIGGFIANTPNFHKEDGSGYKFLADQIIEIDKFNPNLAANLTKELASPHRYPEKYLKLMKEQLLRLKDQVKSSNTQEIVIKSLELLEKKEAEKSQN